MEYRILKVNNCDVLLDVIDWVRLCRIKWKIRSPKHSDSKYICCNRTIQFDGEKRKKTIYMHRAIISPPYGLDLPKEVEVHHKNGNTLDNRRANLEKMKRDSHNKLTFSKYED